MADLVLAEGPLLSAILEQTYSIWCEGLTPMAYDRFYSAQLATPWGRGHLRRFALVDAADLLASAKEYSFAAVLDGQSVRVVGLGAVFTNPAHRGRGVARDLIERMLARATEGGADLALLFSEIGADYYARSGFEAIHAKELTLRVKESDRRGAPATLVRAATEDDLADIVAMGETRAAPFRFHLVRDRDLVHYATSKKRLLAGLGPAGMRELQLFVAEEGASAAAYAAITTLRSAGVSNGRDCVGNHLRGVPTTWILEECGDRDPSGARVGAILQTLIARDPAEPRPQIIAWLPAGFRPPQIAVADERPTSEMMMVRALSARARAAMPLRAEDVLFWHTDVF